MTASNHEDHKSSTAALADSISDDFAKLILRVTVAGLMLFHGIAKIMNGVGGIEGMLENAGLPLALAYAVYVGEVIAPVLIICGAFTRISSLVLAINMLAAIYLGHRNELFSLNQHGGWMIELPLLFFAGAVCILLFGPGRFSIKTGRGIFR